MQFRCQIVQFLSVLAINTVEIHRYRHCLVCSVCNLNFIEQSSIKKVNYYLHSSASDVCCCDRQMVDSSSDHGISSCGPKPK